MGGDVGSSPTMLPERVASSNRKDTASHLRKIQRPIVVIPLYSHTDYVV